MEPLKVGIIQMTTVKDKSLNLISASKLINDAASSGADIVILPEMFNCPYSNKYFDSFSEKIDLINLEESSRTIHLLSKIAKEKNIYIVGGSIPEKDDSKLYNTCCVIDNNGSVIAKHRKLHLFDVNIENKINFKESDTFSKGDSITVFNTKWGKMGVAICFDIRFDEIFRLMALSDANIIFVPAIFNNTTGPLHWELLFRARAVDNQVFMIGCCGAHNPNISYLPYGHSIATDPWGNIIGEIPNNSEDILLVDINLDQVSKVRQQLPLLHSRRDDIYKIEVNNKG